MCAQDCPKSVREGDTYLLVSPVTPTGVATTLEGTAMLTL